MPFSMGNMSQVIFRKFHSVRIKLHRALSGYFLEASHDMNDAQIIADAVAMNAK